MDVMVTAASMVVDQQLSAKLVSEKLKIPYTTVSDWAKKYRSGGARALEPKQRADRKARVRVKPDARRRAVMAVRQAQPFAGSRRIRDVVKRFFGIGASQTTVRRVLKEEGLGEAPQAPKP